MSSKKPLTSEQKEALINRVRGYDPPSGNNISEYKRRFWNETAVVLNGLSWVPKLPDNYKRAWNHLVSNARKKNPEEQSHTDKEIIILQEKIDIEKNQNNKSALKRSPTSGAYETETFAPKKAQKIADTRNTVAYAVVNELHNPFSTSLTLRKLPNGEGTSGGEINDMGQIKHTGYLEQKRAENNKTETGNNNNGKERNHMPRITNVMSLPTNGSQEELKDFYRKIKDTTNDLGLMYESEDDDELDGLPKVIFQSQISTCEDAQDEKPTQTHANKSNVVTADVKTNEPLRNASQTFNNKSIINGVGASGAEIKQLCERNHTNCESEQKKAKTNPPTNCHRNKEAETDENEETNVMPEGFLQSKYFLSKTSNKNNEETYQKSNKIYRKRSGQREIDENKKDNNDKDELQNNLSNYQLTYSPSQKSTIGTTDGKLDVPPKDAHHFSKLKCFLNGLDTSGRGFNVKDRGNNSVHLEKEGAKTNKPTNFHKNKETDEYDKGTKIMSKGLHNCKYKEGINNINVPKTKPSDKNKGEIDQKAKKIHRKRSSKKENTESEKNGHEIDKLSNERSNYQPSHTQAHKSTIAKANRKNEMSQKSDYHVSKYRPMINGVETSQEQINRGLENNCGRRQTDFHKNNNIDTDENHKETKLAHKDFSRRKYKEETHKVNLPQKRPSNQNDSVIDQKPNKIHRKRFRDNETTEKDDDNIDELHSKRSNYQLTQILPNKPSIVTTDRKINEPLKFANNICKNPSLTNGVETSGGKINETGQRNHTEHLDQEGANSNQSTSFHSNKENALDDDFLQKKYREQMDKVYLSENKAPDVNHKEINQNAENIHAKRSRTDDYRRKLITEIEQNCRKIDELPQMNLLNSHSSHEKGTHGRLTPANKSNFVRNNENIDVPLKIVSQNFKNSSVINGKETTGRKINQMDRRTCTGHSGAENNQPTRFHRRKETESDENNEETDCKPGDILHTQYKEEIFTSHSDSKEADHVTNEFPQVEHDVTQNNDVLYVPANISAADNINENLFHISENGSMETEEDNEEIDTPTQTETTKRRFTGPDEAMQQRPPKRSFLSTKESSRPLTDQNELTLVIYRADGKAMTETYAAEVKKRVVAMIKEGARERVGGAKLSFVRSELVAEGYYLVIAETTDAREWLLTKHFGKHEEVDIKIRKYNSAQLEVWIPGKEEDQVEDPMELLIAQNDHRAELRVTEWTLIHRYKYDLGHRLVVGVPQEVGELDQDVIKLSYEATKVDAKQLRNTPSRATVPEEIGKLDQDDSYEAIEEEAGTLWTIGLEVEVPQELREQNQNVINLKTAAKPLRCMPEMGLPQELEEVNQGDSNEASIQLRTILEAVGVPQEIGEINQDDRDQATKEDARPLRITPENIGEPQEVRKVDQIVSYEATKEGEIPFWTTFEVVRVPLEAGEINQGDSYEAAKEDTIQLRTTLVVVGVRQGVGEADKDDMYEATKKGTRPIRTTPERIGVPQEVGEVNQDVSYEGTKEDAITPKTNLDAVGMSEEIREKVPNVSSEATEHNTKRLKTVPVVVEVEEVDQDVEVDHEATIEDARPPRTTSEEVEVPQEVGEVEKDENYEATQIDARPLSTMPEIVGVRQEFGELDQRIGYEAAEEAAKTLTIPTVLVAMPQELGELDQNVIKSNYESEKRDTTYIWTVPLAKLTKVEEGTAEAQVEISVESGSGTVDQVVTPSTNLTELEAEMEVDETGDLEKVDNGAMPEDRPTKVKAEVEVDEAGRLEKVDEGTMLEARPTKVKVEMEKYEVGGLETVDKGAMLKARPTKVEAEMETDEAAELETVDTDEVPGVRSMKVEAEVETDKVERETDEAGGPEKADETVIYVSDSDEPTLRQVDVIDISDSEEPTGRFATVDLTVIDISDSEEPSECSRKGRRRDPPVIYIYD